MIPRTLVPLDESNFSERVLSYVVSIARACKARVIVLHAMSTGSIEEEAPESADGGEPRPGWFRLWGPWLAVTIVAVALATELVHEASVGVFSLQALPLQLMLASPVVLLLLLTAIALQQHTLLGGMTRTVRRLVLWVPRIVLLAFAAFIGLFALDVFSAGYDFLETLLALAIHLLPTVLLLGAAWLAWRRPWVGAVCSVGWSAWYLAESWGRFPISVYTLLVGAPLLVGALFALDWWCGTPTPSPPSHSPEGV
jgi:hypothetical protein